MMFVGRSKMKRSNVTARYRAWPVARMASRVSGRVGGKKRSSSRCPSQVLSLLPIYRLQNHSHVSM